MKLNIYSSDINFDLVLMHILLTRIYTIHLCRKNLSVSNFINIQLYEIFFNCNNYLGWLKKHFSFFNEKLLREGILYNFLDLLNKNNKQC